MSFPIRSVKQHPVRRSPQGSVREAPEDRSGQESTCQAPQHLGPRGALLKGAPFSARLQHSISKGKGAPQHPIYSHLSGRAARSYDLDQRSFENRDNQMKSQRVPQLPLSAMHTRAAVWPAHAGSRSGSPQEPLSSSHSESKPSKLKRHSGTNRHASNGGHRGRGTLDYVFPLLCMPVLGGATWFCYIHIPKDI